MASGGNSTGGDGREPHQPRNLQGLLTFCTENTGQEAATDVPRQPMSDEVEYLVACVGSKTFVQCA